MPSSEPPRNASGEPLGKETSSPFKTVVKRWRLIVLTTMVVSGLAYLYTYRMPKIYASTCTMIIDPSAPRIFTSSQISDVVEMGSGSFWADMQFYQTQYKIIGSKEVARRAAEALGLGADPDYPAPHSGVAGQIRDVTGFVQASVTVKPVRDSRLVQIIVQDRKPERAAQIANAMAAAYMDSNLEHKLEGNSSASVFLGDQVVAVGARLRKAEFALYEYRRQHQLLDVNLDARQNINVQNVQSFTQRLADLRVRKVELESARKLILLARDNLDEQESLPEVRQNPVIQQLRVMLVDMTKTLAELETTYGEKHPKVESLKAKLLRTRQEYVSEIEKLLKTNENLYLTIEDNEKALNKLLEREKHDAIELSKLEVEFRPLIREAEDTQNLYKLVTQRQKETGLSGLVRANNVRVMDTAVPNGVPTKPRPMVNVGLGFFVGLLLGVGGALGAEALDNTLKTQEEVESRLRAPVLGMLPIIGEKGNKAAGGEQKERDLSVFHDSKSAAAEACRSIRTNLMFLSPDEPLKSIVVTSPGPAEGKTTTAISIAITMAQAGARVLLVDTDLRRPRLHRAFGLKNEVGVSNLIVGEKTLEEVTFQTVVPNLTLCPCGPLPPNPAELLHTRRFKDFIAECTRKYDKVVFDSPPTSAVTDPVLIGNMTDGVVLVVRAGHTTREAAGFARRQLDDAKARLLGCVVNRVDPSDRYYNYYYSRYYRYYRTYQYGYGGNDKNAKA